MNTELMVKAQTLLYSHIDKLEALVEALESVCSESNTEVPETPIHPLINYTVSEKDIGSLVKLWDTTEVNSLTSFLTSVDTDEINLHYGNKDNYWDNAKPYTDTIKLHFKPWVAIEGIGMPSDVASGDCVYVLFNDGRIEGDCNPEDWIWDNSNAVHCTIIGYCKLSFVNPVLEK